MDVLWAYALLALTTLPPLVPNSGLLVAAGVLASQGSLNLALVLLVVAGSALLGDLLMNLAGRRFSGPVQRWAGRSRRRRALLDWTTLQIQRHGVPFVIAARFLPSGRLIGALAAGVVRYPVRRYLLGAGIAEVVWAAYSVGLGYVGSAAAGDPFYAALLGIGLSALVAGVGALVQSAGRRGYLRRGRFGSGEGPVAGPSAGAAAGSGDGLTDGPADGPAAESAAGPGDSSAGGPAAEGPAAEGPVAEGPVVGGAVADGAAPGPAGASGGPVAGAAGYGGLRGAAGSPPRSGGNRSVDGSDSGPGPDPGPGAVCGGGAVAAGACVCASLAAPRGREQPAGGRPARRPRQPDGTGSRRGVRRR
ncbi:VTT domain-containing protein [Streptomyces sp. NPDC001922]|uniref:VTT domain-containing protein n=1 Tax=Streptomyces sp. NPDC001922 TaxID=3364624 RepID=UPI00369FAF84